MRPIPHAILVPFLKREEADVLRVYDDARPKKILKIGDAVDGTLTAGVGHTDSSLRIGMAVTASMSSGWLRSDLVYKAGLPLERKIGKVAEALTDHQYAALLSFVFNLGTGDPKKPEWTIWKRLRAGQLDQVPGEMIKFVNWDGKRSSGLVNRRTAEIQLWHTGDPMTADVAPPSSVTRVTPTPPTPAAPRKLLSGPMVTTAGTAIATGAAAISQVSEAITPAAYASEHLMKVVTWLALISAALAVAGLVVTWLKHRADRN